MRSAARTTVQFVIAVTLSACGRNHQRSERYVGESPASDASGVHLGFDMTRSDDDAGFFGDREIREGAPYTIVVFSKHETTLEGRTVTLDSDRRRRGDRPDARCCIDATLRATRLRREGDRAVPRTGGCDPATPCNQRRRARTHRRGWCAARRIAARS